MGRPRLHDTQTARMLLDAAERAVSADGFESLSVRALAAEVGTSTRAVYSLYGSKEGLVVALGVRAFDRLGSAIRRQPSTADPAADLVAAGIQVFRQFAIGHPSLYQLAVQYVPAPMRLACEFRDAANQALDGLRDRVAPLAEAGLIEGRGVEQATWEFHALCEGLAAVELRGQLGAPGQSEQVWRDALTALVTGFAAAPAAPPPALSSAAPPPGNPSG
ncbi:MAG: TetR/AcrR family transcriptional regulator [Actinomycetota bacterium]|nr:TetR/AcrR family transcriptional regulator [Actinomycetota bacterium]